MDLLKKRFHCIMVHGDEESKKFLSISLTQALFFMS